MKDKTFNTLGFLFILAVMLSTLLIFIIKPWIVLIINVCGYILFRILFRDEHGAKPSFALSYWVLVILSVCIMVLTMYFPEKICDGRLLHALESANNSTPEKIIEIYHGTQGVGLTISIVYSVIWGIVLCCNISYEEKHYVPCLSVPLTSLGLLIISNLSWHIGLVIPLYIIFFLVMSIVQMCTCDLIPDRGSGSSSSGGNDTYHVFIFKD